MDSKKERFEGREILWFSKVNRDLFGSVGEKGANLGELYNNHFPVPNGFIVTAESYSSFLVSSGLDIKIKELLGQIDINNSEQVENACSKIKALILGAEFSEELKEEILESYENLGTNKLDIEKGSAYDILNSANEPVFVSVRASLFRDEFENELREQNTYLNVKGNGNLLDHIKNCFASLFNPETIKRELKTLNLENLKIAVIVQKMVESEKSGIVYSSDFQRNIVIDAIWGLGEGMNLKEISSDRYILSRELDFLDKKIGSKNFLVMRDSSGELRKKESSEERKSANVLNKYEMQRLGDFAQKIESHFKSPQKIEFAIDGGDIYLLQTRELKKLISSELKRGEEKERVIEEIQKVKIKENDSIEIIPVQKITKTKLKLELDSPNLIDEAVKTGLKKVGILKIEKIIKENKKHPFYYLDSNYVKEYEDLIYRGIEKVKNSFEEIWIRTSNFESLDFNSLEGSRNVLEKNPFLGLRGIRFGLRYVDILESELNAIKRISQGSDVGVLIPNIISLEELTEVKKYVDPSLKVGIVVETSAAVQLIKDFCASVDSVLIDGDNLLQNILCVDRENSDVKELFNELHPAFLYQLEYMVRVCKRNDVSVSLFGKVLEKKEILKYLVEKGIDFICVSPKKAGKISENVSQIEEQVLKGTDKEPRQYELEKQKKEYISSEEKVVPKEISEEEPLVKIPENDLISDEEVKELIPETEEDLNEDLDSIEKEKKEYLENSGEKEIEEDSVSEGVSLNFEQEKNEIEEKNSVLENVEEEKPENFTFEDQEEREEFIEDEIIGETKENFIEEKKDSLGLFG